MKNQGLLGFLLPAKQLSLMGRSPGLSSTSLVQISLESPADFISQPRSMVLGRVPHVRPSVHGPKTDFSNAFTPSATILAFRRSLLPAWQKRWKGCAPSFSAHVRWANMGHPSREVGLVVGSRAGLLTFSSQAFLPNRPCMKGVCTLSRLLKK